MRTYDSVLWHRAHSASSSNRSSGQCAACTPCLPLLPEPENTVVYVWPIHIQTYLRLKQLLRRAVVRKKSIPRNYARGGNKGTYVNEKHLLVQLHSIPVAVRVARRAQGDGIRARTAVVPLLTMLKIGNSGTASNARHFGIHGTHPAKDVRVGLEESKIELEAVVVYRVVPEERRKEAYVGFRHVV